MRIFWILLIAVAGLTAGYLFTRLEGTAPLVETDEAAAVIGGEHAQEVRVSDEGTGLESVRIWIESGEKEHVLAEAVYPGSLFTGAEQRGERVLEVRIEPKSLGISDGPATLHIEALDYSWRGNRSHVEVPLEIDTRPPRLSVQTGLTYVRLGGTEVMVYRISEEVARHGVRVGDVFFPGFTHPRDPALRIAFFALPHDSGADARPQVIAVDRAGNEATAETHVEVIEQSFPRDDIRLTEGFMRRKAEEIGVAPNGDALAAYLKINGELRKRNADQIHEICQSSRDQQLWSGAFLQLPGSHVGARFAERRTYSYEGRTVDHQVHLGYDLASTARAKVPAANDGVVAFADQLGIYGLTVILDHGLGLFSLYGHLSELSVDVGQAVARGEQIGRTGTTGLAGGDHLHFSMLVSGEFVDPLEWFDERWILEHLEPKLALQEAAEE
jgi:murein DD-endopeptidase MepM/ murein hydrolase activator NlpD